MVTEHVMAPNLHYRSTLLLQLLLATLVLLKTTQASVSNNQFQTIRKLSSLRLYKDAQFFRYQIPAEISTATFVLNASQSDVQVNTTFAPSLWGPSPSTIPASLVPKPTPPPTHKYINFTILTVYSQKVTKFYSSLLSTSCRKPLDVSFVLRWGSLPLLSIKNSTAPENFIFNNQSEQYQVDLKTDSQNVVFNLTNPLPGDWYGIAYIKQVNDKISQKGLERECFYQLMSSLTMETIRTNKEATILTTALSSPLKQSLLIDHHDNQSELFYKFYSSTKEHGAKIVINNCQFQASSNLRHHPIQTSSSSAMYPLPANIMSYDQTQNHSLFAANVSCPIRVNMRLLALPSSTKQDFTFDCKSNHSNGQVEVRNGKCIIDLPTYAPNEWNYIQIVPSLYDSKQSVMFESRTRPVYGSINFTIQLLIGQEAFLYNFFNDQQCQSTTLMSPNSGMPSTTHNPILSYQNNFGIHNEAHNVYNKFITTAASNIVAPPKVNSVSLNNDINTNQINPSVNAEDFSLKSTESAKIKPKPPVSVEPNNHGASHATEPPVIHNNGNEDSIDYEDEEEEDEKSNQLDKRSADQSAINKDRKKSDRRKEERRLKKLKNKNRQKNKNAQKLSSECQFDPIKILSTLDEDDLSNMTTFNTINLTRYQASDNFEFRYSYLNADTFVNNVNHTASAFVEVENDRLSLANFTIIPQFDIGGSFVIDFSISPLTNHTHQNVSAILCLTHNRLPPIYQSASGYRWDEACYGYLVSNTSVANFTTDGSPIRTLAVPYPQPGTWFISLAIRCYSEDDTLEDLMTSNEFSCDYLNKTSVLIDIRSSACYNSRCLNGGKCQQYLNGGILYSTCSCRAGWKGWICNDGSEALSEEKLLFNFLLLTVSNAAFIPAIIVAACRRYFTESAIYLIAMLSSSLYHACDSAYSQSYCVLSVGLLQFADFYSAILAFFVTLITLANLSPACKSFLHLLGAIMIALITQNDRTNLWTFAIPAGLATVFLFICWCTHCCRKSCYPPTRCWVFSVCPALILTAVGLIIYAFFETQENYAITHSVWHVIVAMALLFAIPSMPSTSSTENEEEDDERVHFMSSSSSSGAGSGKGIQNAKMAHVEWRPPHTSFKFLHDDVDML